MVSLSKAMNGKDKYVIIDINYDLFKGVKNKYARYQYYTFIPISAFFR